MKIVFGEKHSEHFGIKRVEMFVEKLRGGRTHRRISRGMGVQNGEVVNDSRGNKGDNAVYCTTGGV